MGEYSTPWIAKLLGISQRRVLTMIERGYFDASIQPACGFGSKRRYSDEDLIKAWSANELHKLGFQAKVIKKVCTESLEGGFEKWEHF